MSHFPPRRLACHRQQLAGGHKSWLTSAAGSHPEADVECSPASSETWELPRWKEPDVPNASPASSPRSPENHPRLWKPPRWITNEDEEDSDDNEGVVIGSDLYSSSSTLPRWPTGAHTYKPAKPVVVGHGPRGRILLPDTFQRVRDSQSKSGGLTRLSASIGSASMLSLSTATSVARSPMGNESATFSPSDALARAALSIKLTRWQSGHIGSSSDLDALLGDESEGAAPFRSGTSSPMLRSVREQRPLRRIGTAP